jgi:hypothetical protein
MRGKNYLHPGEMGVESGGPRCRFLFPSHPPASRRAIFGQLNFVLYMGSVLDLLPSNPSPSLLISTTSLNQTHIEPQPRTAVFCHLFTSTETSTRMYVAMGSAYPLESRFVRGYVRKWLTVSSLMGPKMNARQQRHGKQLRAENKRWVRHR